ncbi:acyl-CoA dehydrogenase family protein [Pendulispora albinea]|uniref:Acyl-CoA dehydrogenase family protein n=1 Tax=Pendulispora albinea TaxID=2741071 RepID=A0ABZ2LSG7_9BACT
MAEATARRKSSTFERVARGPLRLLTQFGGAEFADKLGLRGPAAKILYHGAKTSMRAATKAATVLSGSKSSGQKPARLKSAAGSGLFDPTPTQEQILIRDTMRRFADEVLRPAAYTADEAAKAPKEILEQSQGLGLAQLAIPEALGGMAEVRSHVAGALIAEQLARGDMGLALAILAPLGVVNAIVDWGTAEQQERYLAPFLQDTFVPTALALVEPRPLFDPMRPQTGAVRTDGGWTLHGEKSLVPLAESAAFFAIVADVRGKGPQVFLVDRDTPGLTIAPEPAMGLRAAGLGRLTLKGASLPANALLGGDGSSFDLGTLVDRARIAWGAMAVGTSQAILDYVIPYCNDRQAFGEPVSNRQSVAFLIADIAIETEGMRLLVHRAASLAEQGGSVAREASLARTQCAIKGMKIGSDGVQLLGGHGFIKEHPVERWYRDLRAIGILEGVLSV